MSEIKIAGVMRAGAFSPNHIGNDAAIFNAVAEQLRKRGCEVRVYSEEQFRTTRIEERIILDMCREPASIKLLQEMEDNGRLVINSGFGIENCTRERMTRILTGGGVPYPESLIVNTNEGILGMLKKAGIENCWIKRGESHSQHKEDVSFCRHRQEAQEVLQEYFYRGIRRAVINRHLEGSLVKFYGLQGGSYFYCFDPFNSGHMKFDYETHNEHEGMGHFDARLLRDIAEKASELLDVRIYGGDCIVGHDGSLSIIDFNDWPSFAPCRDEAAPLIAKYVLSEIKKWRAQREG